MTDSTPPGGLDSPPSTGTPQPLPPPTPALPSRGRQAPSTPAPAPRPARRRTRTEDRGRRRDARPPPAPLAYQHAAPPLACYQQTTAARLHPVPPGIRHGIQSARHDQHDQQEREEGKRRRATDEEPRPRVKNFFTRPYIGRTPPRYTPKDTPAACTASSVLFPLVLRPVLTAYNSAFGEFAEPDAQNARQQTQRTPARLHHAHQWTGEPLHFQPAAISDEMTQYLYSIASTHFLSFFPR